MSDMYMICNMCKVHASMHHIHLYCLPYLHLYQGLYIINFMITTRTIHVEHVCVSNATKPTTDIYIWTDRINNDQSSKSHDHGHYD